MPARSATPASPVPPASSSGTAPQERELKLALPLAQGLDAHRVLQRLLGRRLPQQLRLINIYFDTPTLDLAKRRAALRLRKDLAPGQAASPWLQTLKLAPTEEQALSQRSEWERPVAGEALSRNALADTDWWRFDAEGALFEHLAPVFRTDFDRTAWTVRRADRSVVELVLDRGRITAGAAAEPWLPICEIEIELKAGGAEAVFALAEQVAAVLPVLPARASKAARGYALAQGIGMPVDPILAKPPQLERALTAQVAGQRVLREALGQHMDNLLRITQSADPRLVHQCRVGWRRFRSLAKFFAPALAGVAAMPDRTPLAALHAALGEMRDLDVAATETLPRWAPAFVDVEGDEVSRARHEASWAALRETIDAQRATARERLLAAIESTEAARGLLALLRWVECMPSASLSGTADAAPDGAHQAVSVDKAPEPLHRFARDRLKRWRRKMQRMLHEASSELQRHEARIQAKRNRYAIEALKGLLPDRDLKRWREEAVQVQAGVGQARDRAMAARLAQAAGADAELVAFLRGVAAAGEG
jgi:inorganic triphosphatase YgiF